MSKMKFIAACVSLACVGFWSQDGRAAEGATGFYLLGSKGSMAGYVPPPGTYLQSDYYFYSGSAGGNVELPLGGNLAAGVGAFAYYGLTTGMWVTPEKVIGGNLAFTATLVTGTKDVSATAVLGPLSKTLSDDEWNFGDPVFSAILGWHDGKWHSNIYSMVNVPIGQWDHGNLANIGFNRWAIDSGGAVTYLDPATGHEVSVAMGITYNFENPTTNYKTGTEFHVEVALVQHLSKQLAIGIAGYHYQQITGDSGSGDRLGAFEGRTTGLGPLISYSFEWRKIPVSTSVRYFREFNVQNRLEGDAGILTVSMPLSLSGF